MALPFALSLPPWPEGRAWLILLVAMVINAPYKLAQARAHSRGAFAALLGWAFLGERVGTVRGALVVLIALGAVVVEFG